MIPETFPIFSIFVFGIPTAQSIVFLCQLLLTCLSGIVVGLCSGITPGLHLNLVSVVAVGLLTTSGLFGLHTPLVLLFAFVISMAVTHTITDVLASTYLGVPDEDMIAGLLPAQKLVMDGHAHVAVFFTIVGSVLCVFATIPLTLILFPFISALDTSLAPYLGMLLIAVLSFLLWREKDRMLCLLFLVISGGLGAIVLSIDGLHQPLLPLLGGLFGGAGLIELIRNDIKIPRQERCLVQGRVSWLSVVGAAVTGVCAAFLPGIGSSQAGIIAGRFLNIGKRKNAGLCASSRESVESQLVVAGGINTVNMVFSIVTWIALSKARNGAVAALAATGTPALPVAVLLTLVCCIVAPFAGTISIVGSRWICGLFERINYRILASCILAFIILLIFWFDTLEGLLIFVAATSLGILCHAAGTPKHYLMGCLLLQVLVFFLQ